MAIPAPNVQPSEAQSPSDIGTPGATDQSADYVSRYTATKCLQPLILQFSRPDNVTVMHDCGDTHQGQKCEEVVHAACKRSTHFLESKLLRIWSIRS